MTSVLTLTSPQSSSKLSQVTLTPSALSSILDHHLRRLPEQDRVFGTLLGTRSSHQSDELIVKNSFGIPFATKGQEVTVDMDHHRALLDLHLRVNPNEVVVGWYATSPLLNSFSALIHNFYATEASPSSAIHLTLDPTTLAFQSYISSPIGTSSRPDQLAFLPLETSIKISELEQPSLDLLQQSSTTSLPTPLVALEELLKKVEGMVDGILSYVGEVKRGERKGDEKIGRELLENVGVVPGAVGGEGGFEEEFNNHLSDVLMVSYLANLISTQTEISSRLNLLI